MFPEILRSRRILSQALAAEYPQADSSRVRLIDLVKPNGKAERRREKAVEALRRMVDADLDRRTGILTVRSRARDPLVAAALNDSLFSYLQNFMVITLTSQAGATREFIGGQLEVTKGELGAAEERLRFFRERNMRIGNSPQLQLEQDRLQRDVRSGEEAFWALRRQYEIARVEEHRALPVLKVLDIPIPPTRKIFPKRSLFALAGAFLVGLTMASLILAGRLGKSRPSRATR